MPLPMPRAAHVLTSLTSVVSVTLGLTVASATHIHPIAAAATGDGNCPHTAAAAHGWGEPSRTDEFTDPRR